MIQACIDQSVGLLTLWEAEAIQPTSEQLKRHYTKLGALLQAAVDGYTQHHGKPDVLHDVEAAEWLVRMLSQ